MNIKIQLDPNVAPCDIGTMKVCEQKILVIEYFSLQPPSK
jgi:hypothetical protein